MQLFRKRTKSDQLLTPYSGANRSEFFAEGYKAHVEDTSRMVSDLDRVRLKGQAQPFRDKDPQLFALFEELAN